jgi:hypothetical protein
MRETLTAEQVEALTKEIATAIDAMRKAKLLSPKAIMQHRAKNNAILKQEAEKLNPLGFNVGDTLATRKLLIWNVYLENELESRTRIPSALRYNRPKS